MTPPGLRASDADRDQVAEILQMAYVEGRITASEHSERLEAALTAKTFDALIPLTADLIGHPTTLRPMSPLVVTDGAIPEVDRMTAVMSTVKRDGRWRVRAQSAANNFLGTVSLDLTQATFDAPVVEVNTTQLFGTLIIRVPAGVTIRDETTNVLGSTSIKSVGEPDPAQPTIVISGTNILGDVKVRGPKNPPRWVKALT